MARQPLHMHFRPETYHISKAPTRGVMELVITGQRLGRPSRRLTLHQQNLKILEASIVSRSKNKTVEHGVERINHLPSFQEVRLHTKQLQYPGQYQIVIRYSGADIPQIEQALQSDIASLSFRRHWPSIDESPARTVDIKLT